MMSSLVLIGVLDFAVILLALFGAGLRAVPFLYWGKPRLTGLADGIFHRSVARERLFRHRTTTTAYQRQVEIAGQARATLKVFRHPRIADLNDVEAHASFWWLFLAILAAVPLLLAGALSLVWLLRN